MTTISILANIVRPSVDCRSDDTAFGVGTFSWQDPVYSWKAGPGEVMNVENLLLFIIFISAPSAFPNSVYTPTLTRARGVLRAAHDISAQSSVT